MLFAARPGFAREKIPLTGILIPLALAFLLADIAIRRLAR
jgi:hypothetical protein